MSNIYDSYMNKENVIINHDDRCVVVFEERKNLAGCLDRVFVNERGLVSFVASFPIGSGVVYYFGIKPSKIIINNDSKKMLIDADDFLLTSIDIDRKYNRYIMTIEATNEKYIRN